MTKLFLKAELNWEGQVKIMSRLSTENKHDIETLLNSSNQSIYNDKLIINDFRPNPTNNREYIFTLQYKNDLKSSLVYSLFDMYHDTEALLEAYKAFQNDSNIEPQSFDLNPAEGEFGLVFDDETLAQFTTSFEKISHRAQEHKNQEDFKKKHSLNDTEFDYIAAIAD